MKPILMILLIQIFSVGNLFSDDLFDLNGQLIDREVFIEFYRDNPELTLEGIKDVVKALDLYLWGFDEMGNNSVSEEEFVHSMYKKYGDKLLVVVLDRLKIVYTYSNICEVDLPIDLLFDCISDIYFDEDSSYIKSKDFIEKYELILNQWYQVVQKDDKDIYIVTGRKIINSIK
ncbi:hypothetical protein [Spirochaeta cellobiosiphila]|uniref:hypothetical protein n=1 Tax=Spirochaeta cellobiosiphila TaxID=504483 RepID=UPI0003F59574|nr:hypothetical protein [Spirochaeta cellobiosiphila]